MSSNPFKIKFPLHFTSGVRQDDGSVESLFVERKLNSIFRAKCNLLAPSNRLCACRRQLATSSASDRKRVDSQCVACSSRCKQFLKCPRAASSSFTSASRKLFNSTNHRSVSHPSSASIRNLMMAQDALGNISRLIFNVLFSASCSHHMPIAVLLVMRLSKQKSRFIIASSYARVDALEAPFSHIHNLRKRALKFPSVGKENK